MISKVAMQNKNLLNKGTPLETVFSNEGYRRFLTGPVGNRISNRAGFTPIPITPIEDKRRQLVRGFTLLELILVILILSVLTGLSIPVFRKTFVNLQLDAFSLDLSSVLNYARQMAIFNRSEYRVRFNLDEKKFWIEQEISEKQGLKFEMIKGRFGKVYTLPETIDIESSKEYITFYPDGSSDIITITINTDTKTHIFTTEGTSGYAIKIK